MSIHIRKHIIYTTTNPNVTIKFISCFNGWWRSEITTIYNNVPYITATETKLMSDTEYIFLNNITGEKGWDDR